ncbi:MAG: sigma-70 family RNA polymerase sigma factor [bacterium]
MKLFETFKEKELILRSRKGDTTAFGELCQLYRKPLYTYVLRMVGNSDNAKDVLQETLIKMWNGLKRYNEQNKFSSWVFTIAHYSALDNLRKTRLANNHLEISDQIYAEESDNPHNIAVANETKSIIEKFINNLPEKQKQVFLLRQHGEMSFKEISELINEPLNTVLGHMYYAVKKLRKSLKEEYVRQ